MGPPLQINLRSVNKAENRITLNIHCMGIGTHIENIQSKFVRAGKSFNFDSLEIHFFVNCGARFVSNRECVPEDFELMLALQRGNTRHEVKVMQIGVKYQRYV